MDQTDTTPSELSRASRPTVGIGSCLAGNEVRYNGQANEPNRHVRELGDHFDTQAFCPEMGIGLGVPRPPIHLVGPAGKVRVMDAASHTRDYTAAIRDYAQQVITATPWLSGYILVKGSPSCGFGRVKRYDEQGSYVASDQLGIFAAALAQLDPLLPLADDGSLNDPGLRESFANRVVAYHAWKVMKTGCTGPGDLIAFYSRYKYLVMAHHAPSYKTLGRLLADAGKQDFAALSQRFITMLMMALSHPATRRSHSNVLHHIAGYLKRNLPGSQRQRLEQLIDAYRTGQVPLVEPINTLQQHFTANPNAYIDNQAFLSPYPEGVILRDDEFSQH